MALCRQLERVAIMPTVERPALAAQAIKWTDNVRPVSPSVEQQVLARFAAENSEPESQGDVTCLDFTERFAVDRLLPDSSVRVLKITVRSEVDPKNWAR